MFVEYALTFKQFVAPTPPEVVLKRLTPGFFFDKMLGSSLTSDNLLEPGEPTRGKEMAKEAGSVLDARLALINRKLERFGVPVALTRLGNYKEGEWEIDDILSVAWFRNFIVQVVFLVKTPGTGEIIEHQASFNQGFSKEAKNGQIIVPVVGEDHFLMMWGYGPFVGNWALMFPRGFIPMDLQDALAIEIAARIFFRKMGTALVELGIASELKDFRLLSGQMAENHGNSGNWVTVSELTLPVIDPVKIAALPRTLRRQIVLMPHLEFLKNVASGKICDQHTLAAYTFWLAHR